MMRIFSRLLLLIFAFTLVAGCGPSLKERKEESEIHYRMGAVHLSEANYTAALEELTTAVGIYPDDPNYRNALGLAYFYKGMNAEAIREIKEALRLDPDFSEAHVALSAAYLVDGRWDESIEAARAALANIFYRTPEVAYFNVGSAYYNKGELKEALKHFLRAAELKPGYAVAHYNAGLTFEKLNDTRGAIKAYERAVAAAPGYIDAYYNLGLAHVKAKDKASAMKAFKKIVELAPESDRAGSAREYMELIR